ncbi:MAG: tetratricopeptide repeat protein [Actinomycetaceae bacterium]|nr:tetratricopeptide repeat protein [Actinomycetaceae bacterium]
MARTRSLRSTQKRKSRARRRLPRAPHTRQICPGMEIPANIPGLDTAIALHTQGDYDQAIEHLCAAITDDLPALYQVVCLKMLVEWCAQQDRPMDAKHHSGRAVAIADKAFGARDIMTLMLRNSHLYWMNVCGYGEVAQKYYPALVDDIEQALGRDHDLCWAARNNAIMPLKDQGLWEEAAEAYQQLADDMSDYLYASHPNLLAVRRHLGQAYSMAGHYDRAISVFSDLLATLLTTTSRGNDTILSLRDDIAENHFYAGRKDDARDMWTVLAADCLRYLGPAHPLTIRQHTIQISFAIDDGDEIAVDQWMQRLREAIPPDGDMSDLPPLEFLIRNPWAD